MTSTNERALPLQPALIPLPVFVDPRGSLSVLECERVLPFRVSRAFFVYDVPGEQVRGEHAHKACWQFLVCLRGNCTALTDDGATRNEWRLDAPSKGLLIPPLVWGEQYAYSEDAVLGVFASHAYDPLDYINDYAAFRELVASRP